MGRQRQAGQRGDAKSGRDQRLHGDVVVSSRWAAAICVSAATHTPAEGAAAAGLANVLARPGDFTGQRIAVVCTGGNASAAEIAALGTDTTPAIDT